VPYRFAREQVETRITANTIEVFHKGQRIAAHRRSSGNGKHTTTPEHMPSSHRRFADWTIERFAKLRHHAVPEDVDYRSERGLDRALFMKLIGGDWIDAHDNLAICGPSGVGKSWLACALGHKACRDDRSVLYQRVPRLFANLALAHGDGRYARLQRTLGHVQLLILDDWGLEPLNDQARHDLLEILEDRYGRRSTIITSQLPVSAWHEVIGNPTYADAILDRNHLGTKGRLHRNRQ